MEEASVSKVLEAVIFDMDGVITKTATVHAAAWKEMFDEYLQICSDRDGTSFKEFTYEGDYLPYVDGKPRLKGIESFLQSRGINLPLGDPSDSSDSQTINGLGNKKNQKFVEVIQTKGVGLFDSTVRIIDELKADGIHVGVATSSKNGKLVLESAGIIDKFETRVDGVVSIELGLKGKPEGDIFVTAAKNVGVDPRNAIVVEDAISGVQAGRNGGFGLVIGVAREDNQEDLKNNGADVVIEDFEGVSLEQIKQWFMQK